MKFIIQIPQLIFAGAEKVLVSFANDLVERGHEVEILETYDRGYLKPQFDSRVTFNCICSKEYDKKYYASLAEIKQTTNFIGKLIKCCKLGFSKIVGYRRFAEYLCAKQYKNKEYDVAINYLEIENPKFILNSIKAKKYVQWIHIDINGLSDRDSLDQYIQYYEKMDSIILVANQAKEHFDLRYPQLKEKTDVIYNYYDVDAIITKSKEEFSYDRKQNEVVLLSVGRMTEQKKYLRFLSVLNRLKNDHYSFKWYVLGNGIQREEIENKIKEYKLKDYVSLEGLTDNPYKYMKHCDLFVLPSGYEGFPTVTIEAKILNCAVLATDVSGIKEQMIHGETGWIVDNDEESIYEGLKYLMDHDEVIEKIHSNEGMENIISNNYKYDELMRLMNN